MYSSSSRRSSQKFFTDSGSFRNASICSSVAIRLCWLDISLRRLACSNGVLKCLAAGESGCTPDAAHPRSPLGPGGRENPGPLPPAGLSGCAGRFAIVSFLRVESAGSETLSKPWAFPAALAECKRTLYANCCQSKRAAPRKAPPNFIVVEENSIQPHWEMRLDGGECSPVRPPSRRKVRLPRLRDGHGGAAEPQPVPLRSGSHSGWLRRRSEPVSDPPRH